MRLYWLFRSGPPPGAEFCQRVDRDRRLRLRAHLDWIGGDPDPRNSEHKVLAQIQNLFELAHDDCLDHALAGISAPSQSQIGIAFDACHHKVIWTYETIVTTDFIPRIADRTALNRVTRGRSAPMSAARPRPLSCRLRALSTPTYTAASPVPALTRRSRSRTISQSRAKAT